MNNFGIGDFGIGDFGVEPMNTVCIGDLGLLTGYDDCLKFDGVDGRLVATYAIDNDHEIELDLTYEGYTGSSGYIIRGSSDFSSGVYLYVSGDALIYKMFTSSGNTGIAHTTSLVIGQRYLIKASTTGLNMSLTVNGVEETKTASAITYSSSLLDIMGRSGNIVNTKGKLHNYSIKVGGVEKDVFPSGSWGNTTLPSGTVLIGGAQWWKQGIDQNFPDQLSYTSTWPIPMEESQFVIASGVDLPVRSDVSWADYNTDPTYSFTVDTGKMNTVCIGDMSLLTGYDDCLEFDGVNDYVNFGSILPTDGSASINMKYTIKPLLNGRYIADNLETTLGLGVQKN